MTPQHNRKDESVRRANRVIQRRTLILMLIMGVMMFVVLFFKLFSLQIVRHEELQSLAVSQQTRSTVVTASRGTIYDASGNILAISSSVVEERRRDKLRKNYQNILRTIRQPGRLHIYHCR